MATVPTIRVRSKLDNNVITINESDFDPAFHDDLNAPASSESKKASKKVPKKGAKK